MRRYLRLFGAIASSSCGTGHSGVTNGIPTAVGVPGMPLAPAERVSSSVVIDTEAWKTERPAQHADEDADCFARAAQDVYSLASAA